jgi:hypothetical protein
MQGAFLDALGRWADTNPDSITTLPVGVARADEVRRVLDALDRARADRRRRP